MTSQEVGHDEGSERISLLPHWISWRLKNKRSTHWNNRKVFFNIYLTSGNSGVVFSRLKTFGFLVKEVCSNVIKFLAGNQQTDGFENWLCCWPCDKLVNDWDVGVQMLYVWMVDCGMDVTVILLLYSKVLLYNVNFQEFKCSDLKTNDSLRAVMWVVQPSELRTNSDISSTIYYSYHHII